MSFRILTPLLRKNNFLARTSGVYCRTLKTEPEKFETDEPIKFSTSKAGEWQARYTSQGKDHFKYPKSQSTIIVFSLTCFMVYFCMLREENDLDDWLRNIETEVPLKLEEGQLRQQIKEGKLAHLDVSYYEKRLEKVLEIQEKVKRAQRV
ncbi:hypothetical protein JTE90_028000 [Oedothorax gibbosus]|uniref:Uncharacterized protein n=1 Tax=Oedothorax gibbosus TaxID=931172 RepID=A0AAV6VD30_9ARAC|nr:hypothetical protein JTE90_028000 [Oedothorax gibbosus]